MISLWLPSKAKLFFKQDPLFILAELIRSPYTSFFIKKKKWCGWWEPYPQPLFFPSSSVSLHWAIHLPLKLVQLITCIMSKERHHHGKGSCGWIMEAFVAPESTLSAQQSSIHFKHATSQFSLIVFFSCFFFIAMKLVSILYVNCVCHYKNIL